VDDRTFVMMASAAGLAEVNLSGLAASRAASADVKQFAQHMVTDHTKANMELNRLADAKRFAPARAMDAKHQALADQLARLKGADFDRAYMDAMVADHQTAVSLFQAEATNGKDADLKGWAGKTLPTLKDHLKMAQDVAGKVKSGK